ncbi:hypothetical protein FALBO_10623 [Fusarium albosuccineum]|uniref:AAA+ ATPase domain-containing protein n=1 Tax=Fusarium albosuccineum TaxID=1237068 RepID=A0A8H4P4W6_9HYPO|nr:hypothetical protein FALBO_10623 [Fusarium albosuccineum]
MSPENPDISHSVRPGEESTPKLDVDQDVDKKDVENDTVASNSSADQEKPAASPTAGISGEIEALKLKILQLEKQCTSKQGEPQSQAPVRHPDPEYEEYRRMEACLYSHRKEWETNTGPGSWNIPILEPNPSMAESYRRPAGPWYYHWQMQAERKYERPDPFSPFHSCEGGRERPSDDKPDEFDHTIDFGNRRDRIRKHFEWEMDRLYLVEETDRRRRLKEEQRKKTSQQEHTEKASRPLSVSSEPRLNRMDWFSFTSASALEDKDACWIQILSGEPVIDDDYISGYRLWYGYSGRQEQKPDRPQNHKTDSTSSPLPERIRIHSPILLQILATILGPDGSSLKVLNGNNLVLLRPFKSLAYCERALQDWCAALEDKFRPTTEAPADIPLVVEDISDLPQSQGLETQHQRRDESEVPQLGQSEGQDPETTQQNKERLDSAPAGGKEGQISDASVEAKDEQPSDAGRKRDDKEDDPNDITKSPVALKHLKCLLNFFDTDISAKKSNLSNPLSTKVFFSDLWHLFRPGMEVIGSDGKQAYRVIGISSAKHRMASPQDLWYNPWSMGQKRKDPDSRPAKRQKPPFSISCVYIDFDGKHIGPVTRVFNFRRFDGEKSITSLEVYPLRFHQVRSSNIPEPETQSDQTIPPSDEYRQKLIRRGARFLEVATVKHMYYSGQSIDSQEEIESQVVVDFETAFSTDDEWQKMLKPELKTLVGNPSPDDDDDDDTRSEDDETCKGSCCRDEPVHDDSYVDQKQRSEYINSLLPRSGAMDKQPSIAIVSRPLDELRSGPDGALSAPDDELVIMSYRVFGFVLRNRRWAQLDVSHLSEVHPPETVETTTQDAQSEHAREEKNAITPFDHLVLEKGHKPIILSLIAQHFRDKKSTTGQTESFDIVKGKGKGLILLLHGAPGVGKTSTAEGVAELFRKPLFQITCGDLGTTASDVEQALERNFALANRWDCILLLDEADVFLAERTKEDFTRNGLVAEKVSSVPARHGVLRRYSLPTTNRVGDFDEAFTSRIHISLYYPELNRDKTVEVFRINMEMIEDRFKKRGRVIEIDKFGIGGFAAQHFAEHSHARWNGRQIRNACQTALALAEFEAQGNSHKAILKPNAVVTLGVKHFEVLYGTDTARRAKESRLRAILVDENNRVVGTKGVGMSGIDKKADFFLASQPPAQRQQRPTPAPPTQYQGFQQQFDYSQSAFQQQQQQPPQQPPGSNYYPQYPHNLSASQPGHASSHGPQPPSQQYSQPQSWNANDTRSLNPQFQGSVEELQASVPRQLQPTTPPPPQQRQPQQQPSPSWLNQDIQALYAASNPQGGPQR